MGDESRESGIDVVGKQEREALRDRDLQYSALLEVCPDAVVEFDVQARITRTTPQTLALFGLTRIEEALGRSILDFIDPHEHSKATATIERVLAEGAAKNIEHTLIRKDGASFPAEVSAALIRDAAGTPKAIIATIRDITERKRAEQEREDLLLRLAKRVQELQCLCRVGEAVRQGGTLEEIIQEVVWLIPPAFQHPDIACARVCLDDRQYVTQPFKETAWKLASKIVIDCSQRGEVEVYYTETRPKQDEGPFLTESRQLLDNIARTLSETVEHKHAEESLKQAQRELTIRNRIGETFLTVSDEQVYAKVLDVVLEVLQSKYGLFGYINEEGSLVNASMTKDIWDRCQMPDKDIVFPREQWRGIWGRALVEQKTFLSNEPLHVPEGHIPIQRAIAVPIVHQAQTIGLLNLANKTTDYDGDDIHILERLAHIIAPILSARLEREKAEQRLAASLEEKETLLQEIHHRVKNNLQIISSLLNIRIHRTTDKFIRDAFTDVKQRVVSMAMIHEQLYQSKDFSGIAFGRYIRQLAGKMCQAYAADPAMLTVKFGTDDVILDLDTAIPCSLILTELLSNALKHAFPDRRQGEIRIDLDSSHSGVVTLVVADNGVGLPKDMDIEKTEFLGLRLVHRLAEQLDGSVRIEGGKGTQFTITFPKEDKQKTGAKQ